MFLKKDKFAVLWKIAKKNYSEKFEAKLSDFKMHLNIEKTGTNN